MFLFRPRVHFIFTYTVVLMLACLQLFMESAKVCIKTRFDFNLASTRRPDHWAHNVLLSLLSGFPLVRPTIRLTKFSAKPVLTTWPFSHFSTTTQGRLDFCIHWWRMMFFPMTYPTAIFKFGFTWWAIIAVYTVMVKQREITDDINVWSKGFTVDRIWLQQYIWYNMSWNEGRRGEMCWWEWEEQLLSWDASSSVRTKEQNMISKEIDLKMQDFISQLGQHCSKIKKTK